MSQGVLGIVVLIGVAWLCSERRQQVAWRPVVMALLLQLVLALLLLKLPLVRDALMLVNGLVLALEQATQAGTQLVFGYLGGAGLPFALDNPANSYVLAFRALPLVLVVSALSALLWHWRILPLIIGTLAKGLQKLLGVGGAVGVGSAASIFIGMIEAPLVIRPCLQKMGRGELFALMTCGMATVAGTVMALYAGILGSVMPNALGHILVASVLSAPAALMMALIMVPVGDDKTDQGGSGSPYHSSMQAVTQGTQDGLSLWLSIIASLIVFVALVDVANQLLAWLWWGEHPLTLQQLAGYLFQPLAWLIGIPWAETHVAGQLLGVKTILNELLAYIQLTQLEEGALSEHSRLILAYALCGFANFGSLGILLGGLTAMVPERREEILQLGPKTMISGTLATCTTGALVGILH